MIGIDHARHPDKGATVWARYDREKGCFVVTHMRDGSRPSRGFARHTRRQKAANRCR